MSVPDGCDGAVTMTFVVVFVDGDTETPATVTELAWMLVPETVRAVVPPMILVVGETFVM